MKLVFIINTPGQAHTWKHVMRNLINKRHQVKVIAREYGSTPRILSAAGFQFDTFKPFGSRTWRLFGAALHLQRCYRMSRDFSPSMVVGFGVDAAYVAVRLRKPCVVFIDDDHTTIQNNMTRLMASAIVTPDCFNGQLGRTHVRVRGYKELAYLHPNYFRPDENIFDELKIPKGEKYVILRFNSWDAVHDVGWSGFSKSDPLKLVNELEIHARVFISPEAPLPDELEKYRLPVRYENFHQALYHSHMLVTDAGTAATEAATLGTPTVFCHHGPTVMGNFDNLAKYGLMFVLEDPGLAIQKASDLVRRHDLKEEWARRRERMLAEKVDVCRFMTDFIENYPNKAR